MKGIVQGPLKKFLNFPNKLQASDEAEHSSNEAVKKIPRELGAPRHILPYGVPATR